MTMMLLMKRFTLVYSNADVPHDKSNPLAAPPRKPAVAVDVAEFGCTILRSYICSFTPVYIEKDAVRTAVIVIKGIHT